MTDRPASTTEHQPSAPARTDRALAPDLARGMMLALIAVANVVIYLIDRPYGFRQHIIEDGAVDHVVSALVVTLVDARAFPLFAFLFGYGMVQLSRRRRQRGATAGGVRSLLRRRSLVLIVFGAVHGILLFPGDILGWYGVVGLLLVALFRWSDRTLLWIAGLWLLPSSVVTGQIYGQANGPDRSFFWSFEIADPLAALAHRPLEWVMSPFGLLPVITAALVGVVAARHRVLEEPHVHRRMLLRVTWTGAVIGIAGGAPSGLIAGGYLAVPDSNQAVALAVLHAATGVAGGLALAAMFALLADSSFVRSSRIAETIAATGRRSLSAYLAQSLVFVLLLTPPFGGLGAQWGTAAAAGLAVAVWAASVVVAAVMERRGVQGPAERLQRRLVSPRNAATPVGS